MFKKLLDLLFPEKCIKCGRLGVIFCEKCLVSSKPAHLNEYAEIRSIFSYKDPHIKHALWLLKYKNKKSLGEIFGRHLSDLVREDIEDAKVLTPNTPIYIVPVPLSKKRRFSRGYNQSELLASVVVKNIPQVILGTELIVKVRDTIPQAHMKNKKDRLQNLKKCFSVLNKEAENKIFGSHMILVDDITTTGATLLEINRVLKRFGARNIYMYTIAH